MRRRRAFDRRHNGFIYLGYPLKLVGFAEKVTGTIIVLRASPEDAPNAVTNRQELYTPGHIYTWSMFALINPETGRAEVQAVAREPIPVGKDTVAWVTQKINELGYEPEWNRMGTQGPYLMQQHLGPNGEMRMGKYTEQLNKVDHKDHFKADGTVDQAKAQATVDGLMAIWKSGATVLVDGEVTHRMHKGKQRHRAWLEFEEV